MGGKFPKIVLCAIILGILFGGYVSHTFSKMDGTDEIRDWLILESPDKAYTIEVQLKGHTFLFAAQKIIVWCKNNKTEERKQIFYTRISNDGKTLTDRNYGIEWNSRGANLTFNGEEQAPIGYVIEWDRVFQE